MHNSGTKFQSLNPEKKATRQVRHGSVGEAAESKRRSPYFIRRIGAVVVTAAVTIAAGFAAGANAGSIEREGGSVAGMVVKGINNMTGANAPSEEQLAADPKVSVVIFPNGSTFQPPNGQYEASSIMGAIEKVDPNINAATQYAIVKYIANTENNGSSVIGAGRIEVPRV
jgi:hypothetical protein